MRTAWKGLAAQTWTRLRAIPQTVRQRLRPEPGRFLEPHFPPRWLLVVATCVLVVLACVLLGSLPSRPAASPSSPEPTFDLPADSKASNLKGDSSASETVPPPEAPVEPAKLQVAGTEPAPGVEPPTLPVPTLPLPPAEDLTIASEPTIEPIVALPHQGDDTMSSKGNFALQLFLLGWYLTNPTSVVDAGEQAAGEAADRLGKIERQLADLQKKLDEFTKDTNPKEVNAKLGQLQQSLDGFKAGALQNKMKLDDTASAVEALTKDFDKLRKDGNVLAEEVAKLAQAVTQLQETQRSEARKAFSTAPAPAGPIVPPGSAGTLRLVNAWSTPMTVIIDEMSHRLQPGEVKNVTRRAGNFTYEVLTLQPARSRTLVAGETFTIRIAPQP